MKLQDVLDPDDATVLKMEEFYQQEQEAAHRFGASEMDYRAGFRGGWKAALKLVRNAEKA